MGKKDIKGIYMDYEMIERSTDNHAHHNKERHKIYFIHLR